MRRTILLFVLAISQFTFAQTEKGRMTFGINQLSVSYSDAKQIASGTESKMLSLGISPSAGRFVMDNFLVGATIGANYTHVNFHGGSFSAKTNNRSLNVGPWAEYYFGPGLKGKPYISVSPSYGFGSYESADSEATGNYKTKVSNFSATGSVGYALFLNDSFMLRFSGGYNYSINKMSFEGSPYNNAHTGKFFLGVGVLATFKKR